MEKNILNDIRLVVQTVEQRELNQLRLEEELLTSLVQNTNQSLKIKKLAFNRIQEINRTQIVLLGGLNGVRSNKVLF